MVWLATHPDFDLYLQKKTSAAQDIPLISIVTPQIKHRGITHTIWYAIFWGIILSGVMLNLSTLIGPTELIQDPALLTIVMTLYGFGLGVVGILAHILGDIVTPTGITPFYPIYNERYTLSLFYAKNKVANFLSLALGILTFTGSMYVILFYV